MKIQNIQRQRDSDRGGHASGQKAAQRMLLLCTTSRLGSESAERLRQTLAQPVDWKYLVELAAFQGVIPLVVHNLVICGLWPKVPEPYANHLKRAHDRTVYRNVVLSNELVIIVSAFRNQGIEAICLKGTVLAEVLYGNASLRPVSDMDVLVHSEDTPKAGRVLAELGYRQPNAEAGWDHPFHEEPYCKKAAFPIFLELHWDLYDRKLVAFPERQIWRRTQPLELQGVRTLTLSPEDNLLFLANHLCKHNTHRLKLLGDIAELLKKYEASLDWDYVTSSAGSWQVAPSVYIAITRAQTLLGAPVPAARLRALRPASWRRWLLDLLVEQENFVTQSRESKLRDETSALAHCLMMKSPSRMAAALSSYRRRWTQGEWLRMPSWIVIAFFSGLVRSMSRSVVKAALWSTQSGRLPTKGETCPKTNCADT